MNRPVFASERRRHLALFLPAVTEQTPGRVREWSSTTLRRWGLPHLVGDVNTVVTELVTNALQAGAGEVLVLFDRHCARDLVRVAVWDDAPGVPAKREPDHIAENGRGLHMVEALTVRWGHEPDPGGGPGKAVWADLRVRGGGEAS